MSSAQTLLWIHPESITLHDSATANGDGEVAALEGRFCTAVVQISGKTGNKATMTFKGSIDKSNYVDILATNANSGATATSSTANGIFNVPVGGLNYFKAPITNYSSAGSIDVEANIVPVVL